MTAHHSWMQSPLFSRETLTGRKDIVAGGTLFLLMFALAKLLLHFYTNAFAGYGIFRDELYYAACSEHLSAGMSTSLLFLYLSSH